MVAALHEDGNSPISTQSPARPGEIVSLFGTGLNSNPGQLIPPLPTGVPSTGNRAFRTPVIAIGDIQAEVLWAGIAPGFVGLAQVNVRIPGNARMGAAIPIGTHGVTIPIGQ
jgi:uncharacterized protein (TIGR03437 family)